MNSMGQMPKFPPGREIREGDDPRLGYDWTPPKRQRMPDTKGIDWSWVGFLGYCMAALLTFGHAFTDCPSCKGDADRIFVASAQAAFWPLYWSVWLFEDADSCVTGPERAQSP